MKPLSLTCLSSICIILTGCVDFNAKGRSKVSERLELDLWIEKKSEIEKLQVLSVDQTKTNKIEVER